MPPDPPRKLEPSAVEKQATAYFPSGDVYFKTYWQHWMTNFNGGMRIQVLLQVQDFRSLTEGMQDTGSFEIKNGMWD